MNSKLRSMAITVFCVITLASLALGASASGRLTVNVLDVGQGDSILASVAARVYRTDERGPLTFAADGQTVRPSNQMLHTVFLPIIVAESSSPTQTPTATASSTAAATATPTNTPIVLPTNTPTATRTPVFLLWISALNYGGNPEYIRITNQERAQNMTGWKIRSVVGEQWYTFPSGYILGEGAHVDVVSNSNAVNNPPTQLLWTKQAVWHDSGDKAELRDTRDRVIHWTCYLSGCP